MNNTSINIAIAECLGWRQRIYGGWGKSNDPDDSYGIKDKVWDRVEDIPKFTLDLNAMHGAFKSLTLPDQIRFVEHLHAVVKRSCAPDIDDESVLILCVNATAIQRAEAFLRTFGKWKEGR